MIPQPYFIIPDVIRWGSLGEVSEKHMPVSIPRSGLPQSAKAGDGFIPAYTDLEKARADYPWAKIYEFTPGKRAVVHKPVAVHKPSTREA